MEKKCSPTGRLHKGLQLYGAQEGHFPRTQTQPLGPYFPLDLVFAKALGVNCSDSREMTQVMLPYYDQYLGRGENRLLEE